MAESGRAITSYSKGGITFAGNEYEHSFSSASRQELMRCAGIKCEREGLGKFVWIKATNDEMVRFIKTDEVPASVRSGVEIRKPGDPCTDKQRSLIKRLGGSPFFSGTKGEADAEIKSLIAENRKGKSPAPAPDDYKTEDETPNVPATRPVENGPHNHTEYVPWNEHHSLASRVDEVSSDVGTVASKLTALTQMVADIQPRIYEIVLPTLERRQITERQHSCFDEVVLLAGLRKNVYLVGPAGTGKSTIAENVAKALGLQFRSRPLSPDMPSHLLFGYTDANGVYHSTGFRECYEYGGVFLLDEMDNGHPGIIAGINQALANNICEFADQQVPKHADFVCIAAANTHGTGADKVFVGRNALDAATLDRFIEVEVNYDEVLEMELAKSAGGDTDLTVKWVGLVRQYRRNATDNKLRLMFTPRASIDGAQMLAAGMSWERVVEMRLNKGLTGDMLDKLTTEAGW